MLVFIDLEALHHLVHKGVGVVKYQCIDFPSNLSEFKVSFAEVIFEIFPSFVRFVCALPRSDVIFEDSLPVEDNEGEVYCLTLSQLCFCRSCVLNQVVDGVEDDVNGFGRIVDHCFDGGGLVVKLLRGDASIFAVKKLEDGWDEWCNFSSDRVAKGGEIFGVDGLNDLLDKVSFEK